MASPSIANSTRIRRAISTMAWPSCKRLSAVFMRSLPPAKERKFAPRARRAARLVRVFGTVNRICNDDDLVANYLLDQWSDGLEVEPERHLDGLIADRGRDGVAAWARRGQRAEASARSVGRAVSRGARVGDEYPSGVRRGQLRRARRDSAVGDGSVGTRVREDLAHGVHLDRGGDVGIGRPGVRGPVRVDEVRRPHGDARAFVGRLLEGDVEVETAAEVDDPEGHQKDDRRDQRELGDALRALAAEPGRQSPSHGWPWIVKCSLYASGIPLPNMFWMKGVMRAKFITMATLMSPSRQDASVGGVGMVPVCIAPPG